MSLLISDPSLPFSRKADFFRRVLLAIVEERPVLEVQLKVVMELLDKGKQLAEKRNGYVHSIGFIDYRVNKRMLRNKRGLTVPDEGEILELAHEATSVADALSRECEQLRSLLVEQRQVLSLLSASICC